MLRLTTLTQLNLNANRLTRLPDNCLCNFTALTSLVASRNFITELQDGLFDGLRNLVTLDVSDNRISSIGLRVFNSSSTLTSLKYVQLNYNRLTTLEPWLYIVGVNAKSRHRAIVNLGHNSITAFTNGMGWRPKCGMKPMYVTLNRNENSVRHVYDILCGWNMTLTTMFCLSRYSDGKRSSSIVLKHNFLNCDCVDFDIYRIVLSVRSINILERVYCGKPDSLSGRRVNSVPLKEFVCDLTERCPSDCRCVHRPANATLHVYCSNRNLTPFHLNYQSCRRATPSTNWTSPITDFFVVWNIATTSSTRRYWMSATVV